MNDTKALASAQTFHFRPLSWASWKRYATNAGGRATLATLFLLLSTRSFETRSSDAVVSGSLNSASYVRLGLLGLAALCLMPLLLRIRIPRSIGFRSFCVYALVAVASTLWSGSPVASLGKSAELLLGCALIIAANSGPSGGYDRLFAIAKIILYFMAGQVLIATAMFLAGVPGFSEMGSGVISDLFGARSVAPFISANSIGYYSVVLLSILYGGWLLKHVKTRTVLLWGAILFVCLLCSGSRTALAIGAGAVFLQWTLYRSRVLGVAALVVGLVVGAVFWEEILSVVQGDVPDHIFFSLSGRTVLWDQALQLVWENPILGYGFGVGSRVAFAILGTTGYDDTISSSHNGFLEVLLGVGLVGLTAWLIAFFGVVPMLLSRNRTLFFTKSIAIATLATTFMSLGAGGWLSEILLLFLLSLALPPALRRAQTESRGGTLSGTTPPVPNQQRARGR